MLIDDAFAARLVCNAATLDERLSSQLDFITDSSGMSVKQARLDRWQSLIGADDDRFQDIRGVEVNSALQNRFGHLNVLLDQNFPSWVQTLRAALKGIQQPSATNLKDGQQTLPFSQVLQHFVASASRTVIDRSTTEMLAISPQAFADFQQMLLFKLCEVIAPCLHDHFSRYRMINNPQLVLRSDFHQAIVGNELYNLYVAHLESGGLIQFFEEYPVAARAIAILMECWIESVLEFLERLYQDLPFLRLTFGFLEAERVTSIQTGLSDPHNGGRSVFILTFDRGGCIVYKPRSILPEVHFGSILERLEQLELPTISIAPRMLDCGNYGWVEFIEHRDCTTKEEVSKYFENLGAMLALLYSLGTSDIHYENIIAHGSYPVVVDLETLLCPRPKAVDGNHDQGWDSFYTVQRVGLLPNEYTSKGRDSSIDISALGSKQELVLKACFGEWQNINRDNMYLGEPKYVKIKRNSLPRLNGEIFHAQDYSSELISGFSSAYTALFKAKDLILNNEHFLLPPDSSPIRFVLRHTELYSNLLDSSLHPTWMTAGVDRSIELEVLYQTLVEKQRFNLRKIIQAEKNSLESLDIPYFWCTAGGTDLRTSQEIVGNGFFAKSGIQIARELIARLNEKHLEQQISIIRASLFVSQIPEAHPSNFLGADCAPSTILARPELKE
ncbi:type 2 lanthipeptide synthetase LanM family protein [Gloeocapsa sp. BRSZ]